VRISSFWRPWRLSSADRERLDSPRLWCLDSTQAPGERGVVDQAGVGEAGENGFGGLGRDAAAVHRLGSCARVLGAAASQSQADLPGAGFKGLECRGPWPRTPLPRTLKPGRCGSWARP